ncbi:MAG: hypothetical protein M1536_02630 [Firmicutes bacterium]|nr:hypothetical protein [Bacillota bacterium]
MTLLSTSMPERFPFVEPAGAWLADTFENLAGGKSIMIKAPIKRISKAAAD